LGGDCEKELGLGNGIRRGVVLKNVTKRLRGKKEGVGECKGKKKEWDGKT